MFPSLEVTRLLLQAGPLPLPIFNQLLMWLLMGIRCWLLTEPTQPGVFPFLEQIGSPLTNR